MLAGGQHGGDVLGLGAAQQRAHARASSGTENGLTM